MACGLRNNSKMPPTTSRMPSRPLSTRPILKVVSSAGDSGLAGALALEGEVVIGNSSPCIRGGSGWAGLHVAPTWRRGCPRVVAGGGQSRAEQQGGGQRAEAGGEADQAEGANQDGAARIAQLAPGFGCSHGPSQLPRWGAGGQAGEAGRGGGGHAS